MPQTRVNLDWIRGLAALAVCALHCREITWVGLRQFNTVRDAQGPIDYALAYLCAPVVWGSIGVAAFFVLSGYVIHAANAPRLVADAAWQLDTKRFYKRRVVRIYAVLIGALALTYVLDHLVMRVVPSHPKLGDLSLSTLVGNLLALQGTLVPSFGSDGPLWTLAVEVHFYAMYPLLLLARRRIGPEGLLVGSAVLAAVSHQLLEPSGVEFFTSYWFCWLLGFYAAEVQARGRLPRHRVAIAASATMITGLGCVAFFASQYLALVLWSVAFYLYLLNVLSKPPMEGPVIRMLTVVGAFSYTLYAVHEPIIVFLQAIVIEGVKSNSMLLVMTFFGATIGLCAIVYRLFERPSIQWLAGPMDRGPARPAAVNVVARQSAGPR